MLAMSHCTASNYVVRPSAFVRRFLLQRSVRHSGSFISRLASALDGYFRHVTPELLCEFRREAETHHFQVIGNEKLQ